MRKFKFSKLVRDQVVYQMMKSGARPKYKYLDDGDLSKAMVLKMEEEIKELSVAKNEVKILEELADIQELIDAYLRTIGRTKKELKKYQSTKNRKSGSFMHGIFVDFVECDDDCVWMDYYMKNNDKYPELVF